jgi:hypothetical protein
MQGAFRQATIEESFSVLPHDCGARDIVCRFCEALMFFGERTGGNATRGYEFSMCCSKDKVMRGYVRLRRDFKDPPESLRNRTHPNQTLVKEFHANIRAYDMGLMDDDREWHEPRASISHCYRQTT